MENIIYTLSFQPAKVCKESILTKVKKKGKAILVTGRKGP
jgi:hypothetical protein